MYNAVADPARCSDLCLSGIARWQHNFFKYFIYFFPFTILNLARGEIPKL